jgi:hypothetical protein
VCEAKRFGPSVPLYNELPLPDMHSIGAT